MNADQLKQYPTPRTDRKAFSTLNVNITEQRIVVDAEFARELECELTVALANSAAIHGYLAEIKALTAENETLRIQHRHKDHKIALLETKLRKAEDYNAILAARAEALDEESQ